MPIITVQQAISYAQAAGFSDTSIIVAIAQAESGLDTTATNTAGNSAGTDRGILQINSYYHPEVTDAQAFDPAQAFVAGYQISHSGTDYTPWSTYNSGAYKQYMTTAISRLLPNALHFSEFQAGFTGTCGETALAVAMCCATPKIESTTDAISLMLQMTREMISLGWASSSGSATTTNLRDEATRRGFSYDTGTFIGYQEPLDLNALHTLLLSTAGLKPIVIEVARAGLLPGDEVGVQYHFIAIVGISPSGYICNDGDNNQSNATLVTYSWAQIQAAVPCGVLVLDMMQGASMGIPSGWSDDGTYLHNPINAFVVGHGFRAMILSSAWDATNVPLENEHSVTHVEEANPQYGDGVIQCFRSSQLAWTAAHQSFANADNVWVVWVGQEAMTLRLLNLDLAKQVATLLQQLQNQPAPVVLDPSVKAAISQAIAELQPQVALSQSLAVALTKIP